MLLKNVDINNWNTRMRLNQQRFAFDTFNDLIIIRVEGRTFGLAFASDQLAENLIICLLYTSPSPRDLSTSRMPSSA